MPDLIRHPDVVPTKVGNHLKNWLPAFAGNPGFRLEFTTVKIGARMTHLIEDGILWTDIDYNETRVKL
jgi:hypothetical protein